MKVYINLALSHEAPPDEDDAGVIHHHVDVVDVRGVGDDEAEAFQDARQRAGQVPLTEGITCTVHWERVEPPATPSHAQAG